MHKTGTILKDMWHTLPKGFYVGFNVSAADISAPEFRSNCLMSGFVPGCRQTSHVTAFSARQSADKQNLN